MASCAKHHNLYVVVQSITDIAKLISATSEYGLDNLWVKLSISKTQDLLSRSLIIKQKRRSG